MRVLHKIVTGLIVVLGCLHIGFTPFNYSRVDMDAIWFLSAGLAIILAGFLNIAVIRVGSDRVVRILCALTNVTFALLFAVALFWMPQPQVFVGMGLFAMAAICAGLRSGGVARDPA